MDYREFRKFLRLLSVRSSHGFRKAPELEPIFDYIKRQTSDDMLEPRGAVEQLERDVNELHQVIVHLLAFLVMKDIIDGPSLGAIVEDYDNMDGVEIVVGELG